MSDAKLLQALCYNAKKLNPIIIYKKTSRNEMSKPKVSARFYINPNFCFKHRLLYNHVKNTIIFQFINLIAS